MNTISSILVIFIIIINNTADIFYSSLALKMLVKPILFRDYAAHKELFLITSTIYKVSTPLIALCQFQKVSWIVCPRTLVSPWSKFLCTTSNQVSQVMHFVLFFATSSMHPIIIIIISTISIIFITRSDSGMSDRQ